MHSMKVLRCFQWNAKGSPHGKIQEAFQPFVALREKPLKLKRLSLSAALFHRAKAAVLMRKLAFHWKQRRTSMKLTRRKVIVLLAPLAIVALGLALRPRPAPPSPVLLYPLPYSIPLQKAPLPDR